MSASRFLIRSVTFLLMAAAAWLAAVAEARQAAGQGSQASAGPVVAMVGDVHNIQTYGAVGDGRAKDTHAIQKAIDAAAVDGGGTVYLPVGRYLCGTIFFKSNVTLHMGTGAALLGSTDLDDYPVVRPGFRSYTDKYTCRSVIYGENLHDIAIVGPGTIDGQGGDDAFKVADFSQNTRYLERPYLIRLITCRRIRVQDISLRHSAMWMQHYLACDNVVIRNVDVFNHGNYNNDMIDIDGCRNVRISDCTGDTGDDALTLKSTADRACENVTVTNCVLSSHCNAIKTGTESNGGFRNITITNCAVRPSRVGHYLSGGLRNGASGISLEIVDGGILDRVTVSNIVIEGVSVPIFMRLGNRARPYKKDMVKPGVGTFSNVVISNVVANCPRMMGCVIAGLPRHRIENVTLSNIRITFPGGGTLEHVSREIPELAAHYPHAGMFGTSPAYGFYARHVDGLTLDNVDVRWREPDRRPALFCDDVRNLRVSGLRGRAAGDGAPMIILNDVETAMVQGCIAAVDTNVFLRLAGESKRVSVIGNDLSRAKTPFEFPKGAAKAALFESANNHMPDGPD